ncbi:7495_t:CDS:10 [Ambispora leptoticha]|uniref:Ubiquitin carboxyl-terminal hydrolase n=1 Tax=Ambispora leptoticha TaxID=144679 RepID=A0A9N9CBC2_9GLOM|nr:7495_t:CDS:10 [Ambispora leptoticha]
MGQQTIEYTSSEISRKVACPHLNRIIKTDAPLAKIDSSNFKKQVATGTLRCDRCDTKIPRLWSRCRSVICSTSTRTHMRDHFDMAHKENRADSCHCIYVNPRTLTIWCYTCGKELNPFDQTELFSLEARAYLKAIIRSLQGKRHKQPPAADKIITDIPGLVGLKNLGNTCYMNAALQALSNTPALADYFNYCESYLPRSALVLKNPTYKLAEHFHHFMKALWNGNSPIFAPIHLVNEVKKHNEIFQGYGQQDSQEFLGCILNRLHEELPYPHQPTTFVSYNANGKGINGSGSSNISLSTSINNVTHDGDIIGGNSSSASSITTQCSTMEKPHSSPRSIISDVFEGVLESRIRCLHCKKEFIREENFYDLPIEMDKKSKLKALDKNGDASSSLFGWLGIGNRNLRLQDCLASFCAIENLTGSNRYECERCKKLNDCQKTLRIKRLPESLCIQLKRFRRDYFSSKITTHVQFPMEDLEMRPYCKDKNANADMHESQNDDSMEVTKYDLYALVHHRGGLGGGHYIAYAKNPIDNNWYEFDDTYVTKKTPLEISRTEAYILFYRKKSTEKDEERQKIKAQINANFELEPIYYISRLWFNRWQFMSNPGPVSNFDFVCPHEGVNLRQNPDVINMVVRVPLSVYSAFIDKYGSDGGAPLAESPSGIMMCRYCEREEQILAERRLREKQDIAAIDTTSIKSGEYWYLISSSWIQRWEIFKMGGPPPPVIDNTAFVSENGLYPKRGMKRGVDYRGVNERVWNYFHRIYGGGPICIRTVLDLYSPPVIPSQNYNYNNNYNEYDSRHFVRNSMHSRPLPQLPQNNRLYL